MRNILITGASRGIGKAVALCFAKTDNVIINYVSNEKAAKDTLDEIKRINPNGNHNMFQANVSNVEEVNEMFSKINERYSNIDVLINCAGIIDDKLFLRMNFDSFQNIVNTNLNSVFLCSKAVIGKMRKNKKGVIINLSSVVGLHGNIGQTNYASSKGAIDSFTKSLAKEVAGYNIRVNAIAPGFIQSDMTNSIPEAMQSKIIENIPLKRMGEAKEVADLIYFLTSENAQFITGQIIKIDGGMTI